MTMALDSGVEQLDRLMSDLVKKGLNVKIKEVSVETLICPVNLFVIVESDSPNNRSIYTETVSPFSSRAISFACNPNRLKNPPTFIEDSCDVLMGKKKVRIAYTEEPEDFYFNYRNDFRL